jgi:hypothetical protein
MSPEEAQRYKGSGHGGKGWTKSKTVDKGNGKHHNMSGKDVLEEKRKHKKQKEGLISGK